MAAKRHFPFMSVLHPNAQCYCTNLREQYEDVRDICSLLYLKFLGLHKNAKKQIYG